MDNHLVFTCALNLLKKTNEKMLYQFFAKHNNQKLEIDFKQPSKICKRKTNRVERPGTTKRPKATLKKEFKFMKEFPQVTEKKVNWSWERISVAS